MRKALSPTAKRAGWIGCTIVLRDIPEIGKVYYVQNGKVKDKNVVLNKWKYSDFIKDGRTVDTKGWLLDVLLCVEKLRKVDFHLNEVYGFESYLQVRHPLKNNIKAKIRQQLQFLRDKNIIEFVGRGKYRLSIS